MATTYARKTRRHNNIFVTIVAIILICAVLLGMIVFLYEKAENDANEMLHIQTRQIKDDLTLQLESDRENLITMANFAATLYADGEDYRRIFESFKPIGMFAKIGILTPDCVFITKTESVDLKGRISFEEAASKGMYISGRVQSLTSDNKEVVRSSVPIIVDGETVGILYGVMGLDILAERYNNMADAIDAQLFVYDRETGKYIIDTIDENPGELSDLKNREYNDGYSFEEMVNSDKGFTSFKSIFTGEDLYVHYSTLEEFNWGIMLARYESQVYAEAEAISNVLVAVSLVIVLILAVYMRMLLKTERRRAKLNEESADIRKLLLEVNEQYTNITVAMKNIREFSNSYAAFFVDTDGEYYYNIRSGSDKNHLSAEEKRYFYGEVFRYAATVHDGSNDSIAFMQILADKHLMETNPEFYKFLNDHHMKDISFAIIAEKNNHVGILGTINPKKSSAARELIEDVAICFMIAVYNKKHLSKTTIAATTDPLTGAANRVAYKKDILEFDEQQAEDFSCLYIDVNELHIRNNKYGHAAGDEMLIYIANTLKEVFFGHNVYRMGGDEFLVFTKGLSSESVKAMVDTFITKLQLVGYNVAIGMSHRVKNTDCEEVVREAEIRMYEAKAQYYQNKEERSVTKDKSRNYVHQKTGIREIDAMIAVLQEHYNGIYVVSLDTDNVHRILMPSYLGYNEDEKDFSRLLAKYVDDVVDADYHRAVLSFTNYDAIKRQIAEGKVPAVRYQKNHGEAATLHVYNMSDNNDNVNDTLWVFAKA